MPCLNMALKKELGKREARLNYLAVFSLEIANQVVQRCKLP